MPVCFKCNKVLSSIDALSVHFKVNHVAESFDNYQCREPACYSNFVSWADFRRHLRCNHSEAGRNSALAVSSGKRVEDKFPTINNEDIGNDNHASESFEMPSATDFTADLQTFLLSFIGRLYANPNLPRSHVQVMVGETKSLLSMIHGVVLKAVVSALKCNGVHTNIVAQVESLLFVIETCLDNFSSEYRRLKVLSKTGCLINPKPHIMGYGMIDCKRDNRFVKQVVPMTSQFIPLRTLLFKFFSLPGVFNTCKSHMEELEKETSVLSNFVQGKLWRAKKREHFKDKIVFPLFVYFDDLEVNNPLGSHKGVSKLGTTFVTIPCIPPEFRSNLENIFLVLLFHSLDRTRYGNEAVFNIIVNEINFLSREGISLNIGNSTVQVYFALGLILGDNLGLNGILGFVEGFTANYFCRFCKTHRDVTHWDTSAREDTLRREEEYDNDVQCPMEESGVKEASIWNSVDYFHVYHNYCSDPLLHELAEGSGKRAMRHIIHHYVYVTKSFDISFLNQRIKAFNCRLSGISNRPPLISETEAAEKKLHMSGSETLNFILIFSLLVGDKTPHDEVWHFYSILRQITEIVTSKSVHVKCIKELKYLVSVYLGLYIELFNEHLKAKEHLMTHWDKIMEMSGPLSNISTMRMESKNRLFKLRANATSSRVNIVYTTALKEQLQVCFRLASCKGLVTSFETGPAHTVQLGEENNLFNCIDYHNVPDVILQQSVEVSWVDVKGTNYKVGMCVILDFDEEELPVFGEVQKIFCSEDEKVFFLCHQLSTVGFDEHFYAFEVVSSSTQICVKQDDLWDYLPVIQCLHPNGNWYMFKK